MILAQENDVFCYEGNDQKRQDNIQRGAQVRMKHDESLPGARHCSPRYRAMSPMVVRSHSLPAYRPVQLANRTAAINVPRRAARRTCQPPAAPYLPGLTTEPQG